MSESQTSSNPNTKSNIPTSPHTTLPAAAAAAVTAPNPPSSFSFFSFGGLFGKNQPSVPVPPPGSGIHAPPTPPLTEGSSETSVQDHFNPKFFAQHSRSASISSASPSSSSIIPAAAALRRRWSTTSAEAPITADEAMNLSRATSRGSKSRAGGSTSSGGVNSNNNNNINDNNLSKSSISGHSKGKPSLSRIESAEHLFTPTSPTMAGASKTSSAIGTNDGIQGQSAEPSTSPLLAGRNNSIRRQARRNSGAKYQGIGLVAAYSGGPSAF